MARRLVERSTERGQAAVLIALCLFTMVVFGAMATNMGVLVNDRIRMQNTADLTAYAGAFEQARALNRLVHINKRIYATAYNMRTALTCPGPPEPSLDELAGIIESAEPIPCDYRGFPLGGDLRVFPHLKCDDETLGHLIVKLGETKIQALSVAFKIENMRAKETSTRAARFTAEKNFQGTARPAKSSFYEWQLNSPTFRAEPLVDVVQEETRFDWATFEAPGMCDCPIFPPKVCIDTYSDSVPTWFTKRNPGPTVFFPARVNGVPAKDFLDVGGVRGGYFGADADRGPGGSDELWAFAVAKPFGGNIGASDRQGDLRTLEFKVLLWSETVSNGGAWDSYGDLGDYPRTAFVEKYRARMAGLQDRMLLDEPGSEDDRKLYPIQLMMVDLMRATHAPPPIIRAFTAH